MIGNQVIDIGRAHGAGITQVINLDRGGAAGKDIAHLVDTDRATGFLAPLDEQIAAFLVEIGQRQAAAATLGRCADLCHFHQASPKAFGIDLQVFLVVHDAVLSL